MTNNTDFSQLLDARIALLLDLEQAQGASHLFFDVDSLLDVLFSTRPILRVGLSGFRVNN